jgi:putative PEP-CTERM system TPR-repeat lipoprotein
MSAVAAGNPRAAEVQLKNLLQGDPDNVEGRLLLGSVLVDIDSAAAEHHLRRAADLGADPLTTRIPLLRALLGQSKFMEVLAQIAAAQSVDGALRVELLRIAAAAHRGLGAFTESEAAYRAALGLDPQSVPLREDLAAVLIEAEKFGEAEQVLREVLAEEPRLATAHMLFGQLASKTLRHAEAERQYSEALALAEATPRLPTYASALAGLIDSQLSLRKVAEAEGNADKLLALYPGSPLAGYLKAYLEFVQGRLDAAEQRIERVLVDGSEFAPARALLGAIHSAKGRFGQAESNLRAALASSPGNVVARLWLAEVYLRQGKSEAARDLLINDSIDRSPLAAALAARASIALGADELAAEMFERSEQSAPASLRELGDLANVYVAAGEWDRVLRVLQRAVDELGDAPSVDYMLTMVQLQRGDYASAMANAQRLVEHLPDEAWPLVLAANTALLNGDVASAKRMLDTVVTREPRHAPAFAGLAQVAMAEARFDDVATNVRRAIELEPSQRAMLLAFVLRSVQRRDSTEAQRWVAAAPDEPLRWLLQGELDLAEGRKADAVVRLGQAFEVAPTAGLALRLSAVLRDTGGRADAPLRSWLADHPRDAGINLALATLLVESGVNDEAIALYETALEAKPGLVTALNNLAWLYGERGETDRAIALARRARDGSPTDPLVADTLGWLYMKRGDAKSALPLLTDAAGRRPDQLEIRFHHAEALAATGSESAAIEVLESILATAQRFPSRTDAARRLAALRAEVSN